MPAISQDLPSENYPAQANELPFVDRPQWAAEMAQHMVNGELVVPPDEYFMMGDNRDNSNDSRFWGFVPRRKYYRHAADHLYVDQRAGRSLGPGASLESGSKPISVAIIHPQR